MTAPRRLVGNPLHSHQWDKEDWSSATELQAHLRAWHQIEASDDLLTVHRREHVDQSIVWDPEAEALAQVKRILDAEQWVLSHWNELPEEHRFIFLHALANEESLALSIWRAER